MSQPISPATHVSTGLVQPNEAGNRKHIAVYLRCSVKQSSGSATYETAVDVLESAGISNLPISVLVDQSAANADRPALKKLERWLCERRLAALVVEDLMRLHRDPAALQQFLSLANNVGCSVFSVLDEPADSAGKRLKI